MPINLGYHEMLSYGHKPWDDDYWEQKAALEKAFGDADDDQNANEGSSTDVYDDGSQYTESTVSKSPFIDNGDSATNLKTPHTVTIRCSERPRSRRV